MNLSTDVMADFVIIRASFREDFVLFLFCFEKVTVKINFLKIKSQIYISIYFPFYAPLDVSI